MEGVLFPKPTILSPIPEETLESMANLLTSLLLQRVLTIGATPTPCPSSAGIGSVHKTGDSKTTSGGHSVVIVKTGGNIIPAAKPSSVPAVVKAGGVKENSKVIVSSPLPVVGHNSKTGVYGLTPGGAKANNVVAPVSVQKVGGSVTVGSTGVVNKTKPTANDAATQKHSQTSSNTMAYHRRLRA
ncbi:hypothetical protein CCR75_002932 [Bremia lactucae]|uniref:Uncharacterized protein n=1 Tax=Bremia lactucae TaxID=4779 RepID=A0A976FQ44_BRELC|nr:hypothetical protein CCR75_002932 [Bremia lactucae]